MDNRMELMRGKVVNCVFLQTRTNYND
jgi:hypothetical protein